MSKNTVEISLSDIPSGKSKMITNIDGNLVWADVTAIDKEGFGSGIEQATYDFERSQHLMNKTLEVESSTYTTTLSELAELAKGTQNDIDKINQINSIVQYYVNKDDVIGRVIEIIENNVNTEYNINYPTLPKGRAQGKFKANLEMVVNNFLKQIDVEDFILRAVSTTYKKGNYIPYLKGDSANGFIVEEYPLELLEVSPYKIDGEHLITMNIEDLRQLLQQAQNPYKNLKTITLQIPKTVQEEVQLHYPEEIVSAFNAKDKYAFLNPERTYACRINHHGGLYGLTPIFKALRPQIMLETFDEVDYSNARAKGKKIYHQILRKEILGDDLTNKKHPHEIAYAHQTLLSAMQKNTVVLTSPGYVEKLEILEPKVTETDPSVIFSNKCRVLDALGIGFTTTENKLSFSSVDVNVDELLKTINKIVRQVEIMLNKFLKVVCVANSIDVIYAPELKIHMTQHFGLDSRYKIVDMLYSKLGASYKTIFNVLGSEFDFDTEVRNRIGEQEYEVDGVTYNLEEVFIPHATSFNSNGGNGGGGGGGNSSGGGSPNESEQETESKRTVVNDNKEQKQSDAKRYQTQKNIQST